MKLIWVTFSKSGVHQYPAAATDEKLASVDYLGNRHRHKFHFKVWIEVFHDDRDIEFIMFQEWLEALYNRAVLQLNHKSCEMISDELAEIIQDRYPNRYIKISVSEDNENGCECSYSARIE